VQTVIYTYPCTWNLHVTMSQPRAVHFGAGNIGRGFIGPVLAESGYHVVFVDVDKNIIDALNELDSYKVHIIGDQKRPKHVSSFSGILSHSDDVIRVLADPDTRIITTAVGPNILSRIAPTIGKGLQARRKADAGPLNVIACENMVRQTAELSRCIDPHLSPEDKAWVDQHIGFASCSVDRIVPPGEPKRNSLLDVHVEEFYEWVVDEGSLRTPIEPKVNGMHLTRDLDAYVERKLFTLNCGHAIAAYIGFINQHRTVDQAIQDPEIRKVVRGAMDEAGAGLIKKHNFDPTTHAEYIDNILKRIADANLADAVVRVGRQPLRKLSAQDRLLGPANLARGYGLPVDNLMRGVAAVFLYDYEEDEQSVELQDKVKREGIVKAVAEITGFQEESEEHKTIMEAYRELQKKPKV
jgi:mannitol-1-phosphate 5-dehydrogenase